MPSLKLSNIGIYGHFNYIYRMNISFTTKQENYIAEQLKSGDFKNASEVVRDALRLHEFYRHKVIEELRAEIAKGWDGESSKRTATQIAQKKLSALKK